MPRGSDPFDIADSLLNAFQTLPGDPLTSGYTLFTLDVTSLLASHLGETLRLRFAEVDNVIFFNLGVDDVHLLINEPSTAPERRRGCCYWLP